MKNPENRETENRDEMMCTRCNSEGLEPHPAYIDEYEGRYALLKATRCSNEDCQFYELGVPEDKIQMQLPEKTILDSITGFKIDKDTIYTGLILIGGIIFIMMQIGIGPFAESEDPTNPVNDEVESQINVNISSNASRISSVLLYRNGNRVDSVNVENQSNFTFNNINTSEQMTYKLFTRISNSEYDPPGKILNTDSEKEQYNVTINNIETEKMVRNINQSLSDGNLNIKYSNRFNTRDISLTMSPIDGDVVERDWPINTKQESSVLMPNYPTDQRYRVESPITVEEYSKSGLYEGSRQQYSIFGNIDAKQVRIELLNVDYNDTSQEKTIRLAEGSSSTIGTIEVRSNQTLGNASLTIKNGTAQKREQYVGEWNTSKDIINIKTGVDEYVDNAQMRLVPQPINTTKNITDSAESNTKTHDFDGNGKPNNTTISFNGGDVTAELLANENIKIDAKNGTNKTVRDVIEINNSGPYRIEWNNKFIRNKDLVDVWYKIDRLKSKNNINTESGNEIVELESGDKIKLGVKAKKQTVSDDSKSPSRKSLSDNLEVKSLEPVKENISPNENVELELTIKNNGPTDINEEISIYQNGEVFTTVSLKIPGNSKRTFGGRDIGIPVMGEKGTNVWFISDSGPFFIQVGDTEPKSGSIDSELNIREIGSQGNVDVKVNGNTECESVDATDGQCELGNLTSGINQFEFNQTAVKNVDYSIKYESVEYPEDLKVDFGNDGFVDIKKNGIVKESVTQAIQVPPKNVDINITNANLIPVKFALTWDSNQVIDGPVVDKGGDSIVSKSEESFVQSRTYDLGKLNEGEHNFRLRSRSGGYQAVVKWNEQQNKSLPSATIDDNLVCDSGDFVTNQSCTVSDIGVSPGTHNLDFIGKQDQFNYRIVHKDRAVANSLNITVDDRNTVISRPNVEAEEWEIVEETSDFRAGDNIVNVDTESVNGIEPEVNVSLEYRISTGEVINPRVTVENNFGDERKIQIQNSSLVDGELVEPVDIEIPSSYLSSGLNKISLKTKDGVYNLRGNIEHSNYTTITFDTN